MPRKPRVEYAGAVYRVMCRGDRRETIFLDDGDRGRFLETLGEVKERTGWRLHAYVLMGNHYHLLLETPEANLVAGMRWFQGTYTARFNSRHQVCGHLFHGRYKAVPVDPEQAGYFLQVSSYIHLNPARTGWVRPPQESLGSYAWSSYPEYLKSRRSRSGLVEIERVPGALNLEDRPAGRKPYAKHIEQRCAEAVSKSGGSELEGEWKAIRRGWYLGSDGFRDRIRELVDDSLPGKQRKSFSGSATQAHDEASAECLLSQALSALALRWEDLELMPKLDARKQVLAWWVRKQTTVSNQWLSDHLKMGDVGNISRVIRGVREGTNRDLRHLKRQVEQGATNA